MFLFIIKAETTVRYIVTMETDAGPSRNKRDASIPVITQETDSNKAYFTGSVGSGKK